MLPKIIDIIFKLFLINLYIMESKKGICILGIESSCDETSASICMDGEILSNFIANQTIHEQFGGVVPELASRAHQQNIIPVVDSAIKNAKISKKDIDAVAFTKGPGLMGSLLVGVSFSKSFALGLGKPLIEVNHMQAHILAHFIKKENSPMPEFPFLCLTVSGGHTQIVLVNNYFEMTVLGQTIDDAAGEAFDKSAKILGLPYPGGPLIDKYAQLGEAVFIFPEPKIADLDFSFSGLKTSILYFIQKEKLKNENFVEENINNICASIQSRIVSILINKIKKASDKYGIKQIAIAGGVSANTGLRKALALASKEFSWKIFIPDFEYCTDNAAMIAIAGYHKYLAKEFVGQDISASPRLKL